MTDIFSAGAQVGSAAIQANAMKKATEMQIAALERQAQRMYAELDPDKLASSTLVTDIENAKQRLGLQAIIDPALAQSRYVGQNALLSTLQGLGAGDADQVAKLAAETAYGASPQLNNLKNQLLDKAVSELNAGSTLPPGVQAELIKAGLEQGAMVGGSPDARGFAGNITRNLIGSKALELQQQRMQNAQQLGSTAANLEQARTSLLASLFPALQGQTTSNAALAGMGLSTSDALLPEAGLTGGDVLNITGARVGAGNNIASQSADAAARLGTGLGQIWGTALGNIGQTFNSSNSTVGNAVNSAVSSYIGK